MAATHTEFEEALAISLHGQRVAVLTTHWEQIDWVFKA